MKRIVLLVAFITATLIQAQNTTPTTTIKSTIPFQHTDETSWILRYQKKTNTSAIAPAMFSSWEVLLSIYGTPFTKILHPSSSYAVLMEVLPYAI